MTAIDFEYVDKDGDRLETYDLGPNDGLAFIAVPTETAYSAVEVWLPGPALRQLRAAIDAKLAALDPFKPTNEGTYDDGYSDGYEAGNEDGYEAGHKAGAEAALAGARDQAAPKPIAGTSLLAGVLRSLGEQVAEHARQRAAREFYERPWWKRPEAQ